MHNNRFLSLLLVPGLLTLLTFSSAWAGQAPRASGAPPASGLVATAVRIAEAPTLDGDVAGDPVWAAAPTVSAFWQEQPDEGQAASERTEVGIAYTAGTLD